MRKIFRRVGVQSLELHVSSETIGSVASVWLAEQSACRCVRTIRECAAATTWVCGALSSVSEHSSHSHVLASNARRHVCRDLRMHDAQAEALFERVEVSIAMQEGMVIADAMRGY